MADKQEFGPWEIVDKLNHDHLFKVRISNRPTGSEYVLKTLFHSSREGKDFYSGFRKEITVLKQLNHPNVLELVDYDLNPLNPYFVTPFYNMGSLEDMLPLRKNWKRRITKGIIRGYSYLHQQGIIKFDNNPKNIFLHQNTTKKLPRAIVGDFGMFELKTEPDLITNTWMDVLDIVKVL